jgi:hypothetical protein
MNAQITYKHEGKTLVLTTTDMEKFLTKIDEIQYVLKGAELVSVTNDGNPVPMIRGW